ncbi:hypothetical protein [Occallatibacter savannae]|uniref:hypothetical protein n=1 Tax=Occallatibacter savannae TaxID=1002691 RepID=UPI0013A5484D|nr:hypothetical protein [Occallatibacter savannae]
MYAQNGALLSPQARTLLNGPAGSCTISQLDLRIATGKDDLRGGKNNLNVEVHFANGDMQTAPNVNKGANWPNDSMRTVAIPLSHPVAPDQIRQIRLVHSAQAGFNAPSAGQTVLDTTPVGAGAAPILLAEGVQSEDNWDMAEFQAFGLAKTMNVPIASFGFHRFTGSNPSLDINAHPAAGCPNGRQVTAILFTFATSDDDLRGGNDNLNVGIQFADGPSQSELNVNHSQNWPNGSTMNVEMQLNRSVEMSQIRAFTLADTFSGGSGGDNWNMASMQAVAILADGSRHTIAKSGFHRFSADPNGPKARMIAIPAQPID